MRSRQFVALIFGCGLLTSASGCAPGILWACARPEMTAVSLNRSDGCLYGKDSGIPFYLPKPLLIVSKNFRNIETPTVGLTNTAPIPTGYDDQSKYADLNARTNFNGLSGPSVSGASVADPASPAVNTGTSVASPPVLHSTGAPITPGKAPSDGLAPETFFTYQIVYVPDLTKRYGLKIRGGPGEIRAAMNLVNGWQFTGTGPIYLKDSSTAQNILASGISTRLGGAAAADVLNASANLAKAFPAGGKQGGAIPGDDERVQTLSETLSALPVNMKVQKIADFAEIHVYEPQLAPDGQVIWHKIVDGLKFDRHYLGEKKVVKGFVPKTPADVQKKDKDAPKGELQGAAVGADAARAAIAGVFGVPVDSPAFRTPTGERQGGAVGGVPAGGVNQIQVDCGGAGKCTSGKEFNLFRFGGLGFWHKKEQPRAKIHNKFVDLPAELQIPSGTPMERVETPKLTPGGGLQGGATPGTSPPTSPSIINQPIFNQPGLVSPIAPIAPGKKE